MPDQIYIGNFSKGLKTPDGRLPFNIDNDAFPTMYNFYSWRGRAKKKRGTTFLARLQRQVQLASVPLSWQIPAFSLIGGAGNLLANAAYTLEANSSITPGSISLLIGGQTYTEPATPNGTLVGSGGGSGTINYATGAITIVGGAGSVVIGFFSYYPDLPVLGLQNYVSNSLSAQFPVLLAFDDTYAYQINDTGTPFFYDISYYKNTNNPVVWSAPDSSQFWTVNYQSAFWATNNKPGLHLLNGTYVSGSGTTAITFTFTASASPFTTLVVGDVLWFNEWNAPGTTVNGVNGTVTTINGGGSYVVTFQTAQTVSGTGIVQMLTNSLPGQDGIRWYDGDMTNGTGIPVNKVTGWVNFAPPLTATSVSINDQNPGLYYLVGALAIVPYKDRLLFFGPQIQTSSGSVIQRQLQDTVVWSWNGTPYYNALVPTPPVPVETFDPRAYYVDQTGFGGYLSAGISQPIVTVLNNEDVLLVGFGGTGRKTRFVYTGNDLQPYLFYNINSELPSSSTFSGISLDRGGLEIGAYGITLTTQQSCQRIDLDIPDSVFDIQAMNLGQQRVNAIRDFFREWIYFSYPTGDGTVASQSWVYPSSTFFYNYREATWAIFRENFTKHGTYRKKNQYTWATLPYPTWATWREPWNSGSSQALFPSIVAGNPQGYVLVKGEGTSEAQSGAIYAIANDGFGYTQITSFNHCVNSQSTQSGIGGDYLYFLGSIGSTYLNNQIGLVTRIIDANNFVVDIPFTVGTYLGLGTYARLCQPLLQTKQFPFYWEQGRGVRLGTQKYLLDTTANAQATINISLSQDPDTAWNDSPVVPAPGVTNSSLIYSQLLYTCPESANIGLTPANTNLQMPTAQDQFQIWHRLNTSLTGDTFQIGLTLSDAQMRNLTYATSELTLHGAHLTVSPGNLLA